MNEQSPEPKKHKGDEIPPHARGSQQEQSGEPPNDAGSTKMAQRWNKFIKSIGSISADRALELLLVFVIVVATIVNVCVASRQWGAMAESNRINRDAMIAGTRAWVVPTGAYFDGEPKAGFNQRIKVTYENVGKEAASDVISPMDWSGKTLSVVIDDKQMPYIDVQTASWPVNMLCNVDPSYVINRRAVYPSTKNEFMYYVFNSGPTFLPDTVMKGTEFFYVFGCFVYRSPVTAQKIHHSPYCLYYQPKRDGTIKDGTFEFCPSGSANPD
jgi:hypothetical protein